MHELADQLSSCSLCRKAVTAAVEMLQVKQRIPRNQLF